MKYKKYVSIISLSLCLLVINFSLAQDNKPVVKIGVILPLSGNMSDIGTAFRDSTLLANKEIPNNTNCNYKIIFEDDGLQSKKVASAAEKLISVDKVNVLISTWSYGGSVAAPIAERSKVLHFATAWDKKIVANKKYSFLHLSPPENFIPMFFDIIKIQKSSWKTVAILGLNESGSILALDEFERNAKKNNITISLRETFDFGTNDFRSVLSKIKNRNIDGLFINMGTPEIEIILRQMASLKMDIAVTSMTGFEVLQDTSLIEGKWYVSDSTPPDSFALKLKDNFKQSRTYGVGNYYDLINLIVDRFEPHCKKEIPSNDTIVSELESSKGLPSIFGNLEFNSNHISNYPSVFRIIKDGKRITATKEEVINFIKQ
jgi:branched-chain amino acid transport system substrate-binding protein